MTNRLKKVGKKAFSMSVSLLTIAWSVGVSALVPVAVAAETCPTLEAGDLFKTPDLSAVYLLNADMERMYFPQAEVYKTWYADYSGINVIPTTCVDAYPAPSLAPYGVNFRPGSRLVKVQISPSVYVIEPGNTIAKIASEDVAKSLYGDSWATLVRDIADVFWPNYVNRGTELTEASLHNGMLVKTASSATVYEVVNGQLNMVNGTLPSFVAADVRTVSATVFATASMASTSVTVPSITEDPSQLGGVSTTPSTTGDLVVSLAANTPVSGYIGKGAYNAEFAKFNFKATGGNVVVSQIVLKRDGFGNDANFVAVRLYDGTTQVGSDQVVNVNTHLMTFKNLNWTVPSGVTKTLTVKVDTNSTILGTSDHVALTSVTADGDVTGPLPIAANAMQYHAVTLGVLDFNAKTTPAAANILSGSTNQEVACFNVDTTSTEGMFIHSLTLTNNGTAANSEVSNFVLRDGSTTIGTNSGTYNSSGKVTIDMTASPYFIDKSKSKDLCLYVDIAAGIKATLTKTVIVQVAESKDVVVIGDLSKSQVLPTIDDATTFTAQTSQTMTIAQGTLTVTFNTATQPTASALIDGVSHNKLAAVKFTAGSTEGARITRLRMTASGAGLSSADISNLELYSYNESTGVETLVAGPSSISGGYVVFEDTNGLVDVEKSKNAIVHVYGDVNTSAAWTSNIEFFVDTASTNTDLIVKAKGLTTGEYLQASDITLSSVSHANSIEFTNSNNGSLTLSLDQGTPAATSIAKGSNNVDFVHARMTAASEDMSVSSITVNIYENSAATNLVETADNAVTNVRLYDMTDAANPVQLGSTVSTPSAGVATFSTNLTIAKDVYRVLKVLADVPTDSLSGTGSGLTTGTLVFVIASTTDNITTTGVASGVDISETGTPVTGRTMTVTAPTLTVAFGVTPPAQSIVSKAQNVHVATLQLTAGAYEDVKVTSVKLSVASTTALNGDDDADTTFSSLKLMSSDGTTQYGITKNLTDGGAVTSVDYVQFTGITNLTVTKGTTAVIYVYANVDGSSGDWYFGTTATTDLVGSGTTSGASATVTGTGVSTAQSITSSATVTIASDSSTGLTSVVAVGASGTAVENEVLTLNVDPQFEDVDITKLVFFYDVITGDDARGAFKDNGVKLYKKVNSGAEVLVGSTSFVTAGTFTGNTVATTTATFNMAEGALRLGKDDTTLLIVKVQFNGVNNGATSASSPFVKFGDGSSNAADNILTIKGVSSGQTVATTSVNSGTAIGINGNDRVLYKSFPTVSLVNLDSTALVNGVENDIYKFKVKADSNGAVSLKQLRFAMDIVDNRGTIDNAYATSFKLYRGSTDISSNVLIQAGSVNVGPASAAVVGDSLETGNDVISTGTGKLFFITWEGTGEETIPAGSEYTYTIKATLSGFNTDADNDYLRVRMDNTETGTELSQANDTYALHVSSTAASIMVLTNTANTATSTAYVSNFIWSDRSASGHSAATGTVAGLPLSTADWFNGYKIDTIPTSYSSLVR